ncbi:MAG: hypothetical protein UY48_C0006G0033 [Candidatus Gottesmanbacteria bacterium GW2011_GWB1_49_7]|uniref:Uncharacterized protein n=1 Tax=Candidatus Gottesmanbacteria bacterium GW2011_GWB1_49_7 TaxID=1618448 RepID=A0A0G1W311_9BACT|nr:MAG: hypothetical protein UY48_C0006G0033 [Candidatus Gottesmanbacteria bacterium GW2011_GWB1_49_7]
MYTLETLPITVHYPWMEKEVLTKRANLTNESKSYSDENGIRRWHFNRRVIPYWVFKEAFCVCPDTQRETYERETQEFLESYRRNQPSEPSDEERFEALAAHGSGVQLVNVFTGRVWVT